MAEEQRPYQHYSEAEIMREEERWRKLNRDYWRRYGKAQELGATDDMDAIRLDLDLTSAEIDKCMRELQIRREERRDGIDFLGGLGVEEFAGIYCSWRNNLRRMRSGELRQMKNGYSTTLKEAQRVSDTRTQVEMAHRMAVIDGTLRDRGHA